MRPPNHLLRWRLWCLALFLFLVPVFAHATVIGQWCFDEGSGTTVADSSGNGVNGTLNGGVTWANGTYGTCLYFDGSSGYVSIPDGAWNKAAAFTLTCWYKSEGGAGQRTVFDHYYSANCPGSYSFAASSGYFACDDGSNTTTGATIPSTGSNGSWVFMARHHHSTTLKVF